MDISKVSKLLSILLIFVGFSCHNEPTKADWTAAQCKCDSVKTFKEWVNIQFENFKKNDFAGNQKIVLIVTKDSSGNIIDKKKTPLA